jgi:hypothetical protein
MARSTCTYTYTHAHWHTWFRRWWHTCINMQGIRIFERMYVKAHLQYTHTHTHTYTHSTNPPSGTYVSSIYTYIYIYIYPWTNIKEHKKMRRHATNLLDLKHISWISISLHLRSLPFIQVLWAEVQNRCAYIDTYTRTYIHAYARRCGHTHPQEALSYIQLPLDCDAKRDRQTDRQIDRQTDRQTGIHPISLPFIPAIHIYIHAYLRTYIHPRSLISFIHMSLDCKCQNRQTCIHTHPRSLPFIQAAQNKQLHTYIRTYIHPRSLPFIRV